MFSVNLRVFLILEFGITSSTKVLLNPSRTLIGRETETGKIWMTP